MLDHIADNPSNPEADEANHVHGNARNVGRMSLIEQIVVCPDSCAERERIDVEIELLDLERDAYAGDFLRAAYRLPDEYDEKTRALAPILGSVHEVERIGNQFSKKLLDAYLLDDPREAMVRFRSIEPHTVDEEMALLITDEQFYKIHGDLFEHLAGKEEYFKEQVRERLDPKSGQIAKNDRYQFNGNETKRSLSEILIRGVPISVMEKHVESDLLKDKYEEAMRLGVPVIELLKNEKILNANGFPESKVSVAVHDIMDHAWGFWVLQKSGLLDKFSGFFDSIGNPELTDIYKREGEIPASICFGVRYWANQERGFVPTVSAYDMRAKMEGYLDHDELKPRHMAAFRILRNMTPDSHEWQSLSFTFSNYVTELDEQRRKHGKIKQRDNETRQIIGELPINDPDFMSLFVELHHELMQSNNKHRDNLFRAHILLEEFIQSIAKGEVSPKSEFVVKVQDLENYDYEATNLAPQTIRWMFRNYGFMATKDTLA